MLADYVLALLRHDGDIGAVRKLCEDEIPDFLKEGALSLYFNRVNSCLSSTLKLTTSSPLTDSSVFVNDVFEAIAYRSYLPGAPPPAPKHAPLPPHAAPAAAHPPAAGLLYDDAPMPLAPQYQPPPFQNGSRKRAYNDWDDPNAQNGRDAMGGGFGGRNYKQPRRGGYGSRGGRGDDNVNGFRGAPALPPAFPPPPGQLPPQGAAPAPSTVGYLDPSGAMDPTFALSWLAGQQMMQRDGAQPPARRRARCRDWERKGYCQRGSNCMFEHSNDPVYPPLPGPPFGGMPPVPQPPSVEGMFLIVGGE